MNETSASGDAAKYQVLGPLGRGSKCEVLLARVEGAGGFVKLAAIKRLLPELATDAELTTRFLDEARLAARLNHANIVTIFDVAHDSTGPFIAMELLEGQPLRDLLRTSGPIPPPLALRIFSDVASALQYAHELRDHRGEPLRIVHRGVCPKNVFVLYSGQAKVVNFARSRGGRDDAETNTSELSESVRYLAPEQTRGVVEPRVDVFSAGIVLWECLTGAPFWGDRSDLEIVRLLTLPDGFDPPSLRSHLPGASDALEALCRRAVHPDPAQRFGTVRELLEALEALLAAEGLTARPREVARFLETKMGTHVQESRASLERLVVRHEGTELGPEPVSTDVLVAEDPADDELAALAPPAQRGRRWWLAVAAVVVAGTSAFFVARALDSRGAVPATVAGATRGSEGTTAATSPPAASPAPAVGTVSVDIVVSPPSAEITFDGDAVPNPYHATRPRDPGLHMVRATAGPEYVPFAKSVSLQADMGVNVELTAAGSAPHATRAPVRTNGFTAHGNPAAAHPVAAAEPPPPPSPSPTLPPQTIPSFDSQPLVATPKAAPTATLDTSNPWKN